MKIQNNYVQNNNSYDLLHYKYCLLDISVKPGLSRLSGTLSASGETGPYYIITCPIVQGGPTKT